MQGPSPARLYATLIGAALTVLGIAGFFYSASFGSPGEVEDLLGAFGVNGWLNLLHIATGALGLLMADYAARRYSLWIGSAYLILAVYGLSVGDGHSVLGLVPLDRADDFLHLSVGALGVLAALSTPRAALQARADPAG